MSTSRFSMNGGPLFEMARARQQDMLDAAARRRARPIAAATRRDLDRRHVDYGAWLRVVAARSGAR